MNLHTLQPADGSVKNSKRIARGQGSGRGGTATRGHKGAKSRSGYSKKSGFEGGQMPLQRRVPKFGFKNPNKIVFKVLNLDMIQAQAESRNLKTFTIESYKELGLASKNDRIKILGKGEINSALEIHAHAFSATAQASIESAGGKAITE